MSRSTVAIVALLACSLAAAQAREPGEGSPGPDGALRQGPERPDAGPVHPPAGRRGPWDHDVLVHRLTAAGEVTRIATFDRAGVPTLARLKDGRLIAAHQHFPANDPPNFDKVAVRFSSDEGRTWTAAEVIWLKGLPEGLRFPFDPTLVPLPDGRVRLYFTSNRLRERGVPAIHSAVSDDGIAFAVEPGVRFGIEGRPVIDCAVVLHGDLFHLYAPDNGPQRHDGNPGEMRPAPGVGYHATSKDGLAFVRAADVKIEGRRRWLGNASSDGRAITFVGTGDPGPSPGRGGPREPGRFGGGIWMATSADGDAFTPIRTPAIPGADPGAVRSRDGGWIVVSTGPPRPGTPSARPPGERPPGERPPREREPGVGPR